MTLAPSGLVWSLYFCELSEVIVRVAGDHRSEIRTWQCHNFHWFPGLQSHTSCSLTSLRVIQRSRVSRSRSRTCKHTGLCQLCLLPISFFGCVKILNKNVERIVYNNDFDDKNRTWTTRAFASRMFCQYFDTCQLYYGTRLNKSTTRVCLSWQWSRTGWKQWVGGLFIILDRNTGVD